MYSVVKYQDLSTIVENQNLLISRRLDFLTVTDPI